VFGTAFIVVMSYHKSINIMSKPWFLNICTTAVVKVAMSKLSSNNKTSNLDSSKRFAPDSYVKHTTFKVCHLCLLFSL
jgi:hypothetical protein